MFLIWLHIRCIQDQAVPLALDVVIFRLLSDVETVKLKLSCKFFFPFKDHQWNLLNQNTVLFPQGDQ